MVALVVRIDRLWFGICRKREGERRERNPISLHIHVAEWNEFIQQIWQVSYEWSITSQVIFSPQNRNLKFSAEIFNAIRSASGSKDEQQHHNNNQQPNNPTTTMLAGALTAVSKVQQVFSPSLHQSYQPGIPSPTLPYAAFVTSFVEASSYFFSITWCFAIVPRLNIASLIRLNAHKCVPTLLYNSLSQTGV